MAKVVSSVLKLDAICAKLKMNVDEKLAPSRSNCARVDQDINKEERSKLFNINRCDNLVAIKADQIITSESEQKAVDQDSLKNNYTTVSQSLQPHCETAQSALEPYNDSLNVKNPSILNGVDSPQTKEQDRETKDFQNYTDGKERQLRKNRRKNFHPRWVHEVRGSSREANESQCEDDVEDSRKYDAVSVDPGLVEIFRDGSSTNALTFLNEDFTNKNDVKQSLLGNIGNTTMYEKPEKRKTMLIDVNENEMPNRREEVEVSVALDLSIGSNTVSSNNKRNVDKLQVTRFDDVNEAIDLSMNENKKQKIDTRHDLNRTLYLHETSKSCLVSVKDEQAQDFHLTRKDRHGQSSRDLDNSSCDLKGDYSATFSDHQRFDQLPVFRQNDSHHPTNNVNSPLVDFRNAFDQMSRLNIEHPNAFDLVNNMRYAMSLMPLQAALSQISACSGPNAFINNVAAAAATCSLGLNPTAMKDYAQSAMHELLNIYSLRNQHDLRNLLPSSFPPIPLTSLHPKNYDVKNDNQSCNSSVDGMVRDDCFTSLTPSTVFSGRFTDSFPPQAPDADLDMSGSSTCSNHGSDDEKSFRGQDQSGQSGGINHNMASRLADEDESRCDDQSKANLLDFVNFAPKLTAAISGGRPVTAGHLLTDYTKYAKRYNSFRECSNSLCQEKRLKEHFHCTACPSRICLKKEEMIRHFKWHKKREDSLQHGFMRYSPLDDCSRKQSNPSVPPIHCPHNRLHTHYHCLQEGCNKVYISTSDVQMHANYHRKDSAIIQEGFQRFRATEHCDMTSCPFKGQKTTHFHCCRSNCSFTFKNKADMEKHKSYHQKDELLSRDGFKKFMKYEDCHFTGCRYSRLSNHIHCIRRGCNYVLHSTGQLYSHKRKHDRREFEHTTFKRFKVEDSICKRLKGLKQQNTDEYTVRKLEGRGVESTATKLKGEFEGNIELYGESTEKSSEMLKESDLTISLTGNDLIKQEYMDLEELVKLGRVSVGRTRKRDGESATVTTTTTTTTTTLLAESDLKKEGPIALPPPLTPLALPSLAGFCLTGDALSDSLTLISTPLAPLSPPLLSCRLAKACPLAETVPLAAASPLAITGPLADDMSHVVLPSLLTSMSSTTASPEDNLTPSVTLSASGGETSPVTPSTTGGAARAGTPRHLMTSSVSVSARGSTVGEKRERDETWKKFLTRYTANDPCHARCDYLYKDHYHCSQPRCAALFKTKDGVREHAKFHEHQNRIKVVSFVKYGEGVKCLDETCPQNNVKEIHYHCLWTGCKRVITTRDPVFSRLEHHKAHELAGRRSTSYILPSFSSSLSYSSSVITPTLSSSTTTGTTSLSLIVSSRSSLTTSEGHPRMLTRKRGRPPKFLLNEHITSGLDIDDMQESDGKTWEESRFRKYEALDRCPDERCSCLYQSHYHCTRTACHFVAPYSPTTPTSQNNPLSVRLLNPSLTLSLHSLVQPSPFAQQSTSDTSHLLESQPVTSDSHSPSLSMTTPIQSLVTPFQASTTLLQSSATPLQSSAKPLQSSAYLLAAHVATHALLDGFQLYDRGVDCMRDIRCKYSGASRHFHCTRCDYAFARHSTMLQHNKKHQKRREEVIKDIKVNEGNRPSQNQAGYRTTVALSESKIINSSSEALSAIMLKKPVITTNSSFSSFPSSLSSTAQTITIPSSFSSAAQTFTLPFNLSSTATIFTTASPLLLSGNRTQINMTAKPGMGEIITDIQTNITDVSTARFIFDNNLLLASNSFKGTGTTMSSVSSPISMSAVSSRSLNVANLQKAMGIKSTGLFLPVRETERSMQIEDMTRPSGDFGSGGITGGIGGTVNGGTSGGPKNRPAATVGADSILRAGLLSGGIKNVISTATECSLVTALPLLTTGCTLSPTSIPLGTSTKQTLLQPITSQAIPLSFPTIQSPLTFSLLSTPKNITADATEPFDVSASRLKNVTSMNPLTLRDYVRTPVTIAPRPASNAVSLLQENQFSASPSFLHPTTSFTAVPTVSISNPTIPSRSNSISILATKSGLISNGLETPGILGVLANITPLEGASIAGQLALSIQIRKHHGEQQNCGRPFCKLKKKDHYHCYQCNQASSDLDRLKTHVQTHNLKFDSAHPLINNCDPSDSSEVNSIARNDNKDKELAVYDEDDDKEDELLTHGISPSSVKNMSTFKQHKVDSPLEVVDAMDTQQAPVSPCTDILNNNNDSVVKDVLGVQDKGVNGAEDAKRRKIDDTVDDDSIHSIDAGNVAGQMISRSFASITDCLSIDSSIKDDCAQTELTSVGLLPEYIKHRFNEDCLADRCAYRLSQTHYHCTRPDCAYTFCDLACFPAHQDRHKRTDAIMADRFQQFHAKTECSGGMSCPHFRSVTHFHCLLCSFVCTDTAKVALHRKFHSQRDELRQATTGEKQ